MLNGRLPWGMFRGIARHAHSHIGIATGDVLTIEPYGESQVGVTAIERNDAGETIVGVLQREGLGTTTPGEFFIDLTDRRVLLTGNRVDVPLWRTVGLVRCVAKRKQRASRQMLAEPRVERTAADAATNR